MKRNTQKNNLHKNILENRKNIAPGHDGISYQMIKQLPIEAI